MTWQDAQVEMRKALHSLYSSREASQITEWALEYISNLPRIERIMIANHTMSPEQISQWEKCLKELKSGKPVQYVTGYSWFMGRKFYVNQHVLIPRPETEELVQLICEENKDHKSLSILDIGTGSGCIPISLKLQMPSATITSIDISLEALQTAKMNATQQQTEIHFIHADLFDNNFRTKLSQFDIIVSNPPYIPFSEKESLDLNVVAFEPHLALFVTENDPLIFYRSIAALAKEKLKPNGLIYFETHFKYANDVASLLNDFGFESVVLKDIFEKERFVRGILKKQ